MKFQSIFIPVEFFRENGHYIAFSKPLDLVTQGNSFEQAKKRFEELEEKGSLDDVLLELGWTKTVKEWRAPVKVGEISSEIKVPCPA